MPQPGMIRIEPEWGSTWTTTEHIVEYNIALANLMCARCRQTAKIRSRRLDNADEYWVLFTVNGGIIDFVPFNGRESPFILLRDLVHYAGNTIGLCPQCVVNP